jgi:hypothetical protein
MGQPPATSHSFGSATGGVSGSATHGSPYDEELGLRTRTNVLPQLRSRVVREARRETWFVVNETGDDLATIPIELDPGRGIRRVQVNGEVAEFSAGVDLALVRPRVPLRPGAGTIVMIHFR